MSLLPKSIQDLTGVIGISPALALVKVMGGHPDLKVPQSCDGKTWLRLEAIMGKEAAEKFVEHYAGERFPVPSCRRALEAERNRRLIADYDGEASISTLVERYQLGVRQIRNILKTNPEEAAIGKALIAKADDSQMALF